MNTVLVIMNLTLLVLSGFCGFLSLDAIKHQMIDWAILWAVLSLAAFTFFCLIIFGVI